MDSFLIRFIIMIVVFNNYFSGMPTYSKIVNFNGNLKLFNSYSEKIIKTN